MAVAQIAKENNTRSATNQPETKRAEFGEFMRLLVGIQPVYINDGAEGIPVSSESQCFFSACCV